MKKQARATLVSLVILALIGAGLFFWAYVPSQGDEAKEASSWEQLMQDEDLKEAHTMEVLEKPQETAGDGQGQAEEDAGQSSQGQAEEDTGENSQGQAEGNTGESGQGTGMESGEVTLVFAGDIYLSPYVQDNYRSLGIDGVISERLLAMMKDADIAMANQEFPFSTAGTKAPDKQFNFRVDPSYAAILKELGLDVVTLANNHALDYGTEALMDSFEALDSAGIAYIGAGASRERAMQPYIVQAGQKNFGFLAASRVIPVIDWNVENQQPGMFCTYDSKLLTEAVQQAKQQCDFLTVYVHWGVEKSNTPEEYQRQLAKEYIDAGADLVVGAHPHVLQGIEYYNGKPIVYSLGNYIFNQEIAATVLLKVRVTADHQAVLQLIPASATGAKTREMGDEQANGLCQQITDISFGVEIDSEGIVRQK